jgi:hypothetical protein
MSIADQKPGVIGAIGTVGQAVTQGVQKEVKKTVKNSLEQLTGKERKEMAPGATAIEAAQAEAAKKQHSQDVTNWLYGPSAETPPVPAQAEQKPEGKAIDIKTQLGFGEKPQQAENLAGQLGLKTEPHTNNVPINPLEQVSAQININPTPPKTPEEQQKAAQLKQQLHNEYYQRLTTPQKPPETEERMEEAREKQETAAQRMERLEQEDLQKKQEEAEKKKPISVDQAQNMEKHRGSSG